MSNNLCSKDYFSLPELKLQKDKCLGVKAKEATDSDVAPVNALGVII